MRQRYEHNVASAFSKTDMKALIKFAEASGWEVSAMTQDDPSISRDADHTHYTIVFKRPVAQDAPLPHDASIFKTD